MGNEESQDRAGERPIGSGVSPTLERDHDVGEDAEIPVNRFFGVLFHDPVVLTLR